MRVLYITQTKRSAPDGFARVSFEMADELAKTDDVAIIYPSDKYSKTVKPNGLVEYTLEAEDIMNLGFSKIGKEKKQYVLDVLEDFSPDLIHSHTLLELALASQKWAEKNNVPFIFTLHFAPSSAHMWAGLMDISDISQKIITKTAEGYLANLLKVSDGVIVQNPQILDELNHLEYKGKTSVIPNGRNLADYNTVSIPSLRESENINLIFVGSILTRKNQMFLLQVSQHLPNKFKLHLVGEAKDTSYYSKLKKYIKDNHLTNVVMHGAIHITQIPELLASSHAFISASARESSSLAVLEGLASGTPFIGIEYEGLDIVVNETNGVLLQNIINPKIFAKQVESFFATHTDQSYKEFCVETRDSVKLYSWQNIMNQTKIFYTRFLGSEINNGIAEKTAVVKFFIAFTVLISGIMYIGAKIYHKLNTKK